MGFQQYLEYRLNFLWSTAGVVISSLILYLFWTAIIGSNPSQGKLGFSLGNYYLLISIIGAMTFSNFRPIADDVWEGDLAVDLMRPYKYFAKMFLMALPHKVVMLVIGLAIVLVIGQFINLELSALTVLFLALSLALSAGVQFYLACLIGGLAFWFKRVHGFNALIFNFGGLFSGGLIPLVFLPPVMNTVSLYLPFRYLAYFPVQIALNQLSGSRLVLDFLVSFLWLAFFISLNRLVWKKGLSQFEATGR